MKKFVQHQKYDDVALINDIALIATKERLPLNNVVKRVILMKRPPQAQYAYVSGWGLDEKNRIQTALKHTNAQIQKLNVCRNMGYLPSGVFCAGPVTGLGAADQGDSGGALVIKEYIQIGLVSYKVEKYSLVAYTNVSMYIDWIHKNARNIVCAKG
ncbi:mast cell protease 8-like [Plodia interpunctella]|uniref:mast cell protease 8-like n=1 Tax=Plodia interpunctella TaxID=58824 RepID=UPI0031014586